MRILGVDPGQKKSGWCSISAGEDCLQEISFGHDWNAEVIEILNKFQPEVVGYEWVQSYGRAVGEDVFRTAYMCGRVRQAHNSCFCEPTRPEVIKHFTGRSNLPKPEVRKVLKERFEGNTDAIKGITNHAWDALAVCVYVLETEYGYSKDYWRAPCPF